jgi:hypothetical protein
MGILFLFIFTKRSRFIFNLFQTGISVDAEVNQRWPDGSLLKLDDPNWFTSNI